MVLDLNGSLFVLNGSGLLSEKPSDQLFIIDTTGSEEIQKTCDRKHKPLKADEILAQRSAISAVDTRKRGNSKVTDGVIEPKTKRQKSDWVSRKEWLRLKQVAKDNNPANEGKEGSLYDPWADTEDTVPINEPTFDFLEKPKEKVAPPTLKIPPISLAANGKPVPSVRAPSAGISYNPTFEEWDKLLTEEGKKEVEAEKKRLEEARKEEKKQRLIAEAKNDNDDGMAQSDDESAWEGFESEHERPEWLNRKRPERKTKAQRNKIKRRKEAERKAKWEAQMKKKEQQAEKIKAIAEQVKQRELERAEQSESDSSEEGDDTVLRRKPLGKTP